MCFGGIGMSVSVCYLYVCVFVFCLYGFLFVPFCVWGDRRGYGFVRIRWCGGLVEGGEAYLGN